MSHHILHQFDEQWLAEIARGDMPRRGGEPFGRPAGDESETTVCRSFTSRTARQWLFPIAALVVAAFALLLAHEAERRTLDLQQRLAALESATRR
jgi:hypothetical protein